MIGENDPHKVEASTSTSSTYKIGDHVNLGCQEINYSSYCVYRLPCGICTRTNSICPLSGSTITPPWQYPNIVYTNGTGTIPANYIFKGETTAQACKNTIYD